METNSRVVVGEGAGQVVFSQKERLTLIAGPCQMESREHAFMIAGGARRALQIARARTRL